MGRGPPAAGPWLRTPDAGRGDVPPAPARGSQPCASGLVVVVVHSARAAWAAAAFSGGHFSPSPASADTALLRAEPLPLRLAPSPQAPPHTSSSLLDPRVVPAARVLRPRVPRAAHGAVAPSGSPGVSSGSEAPRSVAGAPQGAPAEPPRTRTEAPSLPCSLGPASGRPCARGAWGRHGPSPGPGVPLTRAPLRVTDGKHWAQHVFKGLGVSRLGLSWYVCDQVLSDRMRVTRLLTTDLVRPSGDARS